MNTPLIWAHRGASGYAPENTIPAFQLAADMKSDGVELDIQLTKDNVIVICHDETIDRTSNGSGYIKDYTLKELKKFDFCNGNIAFEGTTIPTMEEVFDLLKNTNLTINVELKTGIFFYDGIEEKIVSMVKEKGWNDRVIYSSFNHYSIMKIKEIDKNAKTGFLYEDGPLDMPKYATKNNVTALHPAIYNLQYPNFIKDCKKLNLDINVWTVNNEKDMLYCRDLGVNAIITNYPQKAKELYSSK